MSKQVDWNSRSLGSVAELIMGQSPDSRYYSEAECGLPFLQGCAEFQARFPKHVLYCSQKKKVARAGSILFSVRAPVGRLNIADQDYIIGRGLAAINGTRVDQGYLEHYLLFEESRFRTASQGSTFEAINSSELSCWPIDHPIHPPEQTKIAEVLSAVDRAIEQTEALIAKQQRIKTGLMQDLLTRGIDEHGNLRSEETHQFKDTLLGRIPMEWDIDKLGSLATQVTSGSRGWAQYYSLEGAIFLRIGNLTREHINFRMEDIVFVMPPISAEGKRTAVQEGDILISVTADLGIIAVVPKEFKEAYVNQHIALVRLQAARKVNPRYIGYVLAGHSGQQQFDKLNESGAKAGLNLPTIENLIVTTPQKHEQDRIVEVLDSTDDSIFKEQSRLAKLRRLKTGLMQDLLTGEVRVTELLKQKSASTQGSLK